MAHYWYWSAGSHATNWTVVLAIVYGIMFLITAALATYLAYHGETSFAQMPERHRNRRWIKPLLPVIFILVPALLWPVVMISVGLLTLGALFFDKQAGIWKNLRGRKTVNDVETGLGTEEGASRAQVSSRHSPPVTTNSDHNTTVTEPPPVYTPHEAHRAQKGEAAR